MSNSLALGIDCSETLLQAATTVAAGDEPRVVNFLHDPYSVVCDRLTPGSAIGIAFPSVLRLVGTQRRLGGTDGPTSTPDGILEGRFSDILQGLASLTTTRPDRTLIAVPTILTETRRRGLIAAAERAGLQCAQLIDRSIAAAAGFADQSQERKTLLVVVADYSSVELALIRGNKGRYRMLASSVVEDLGDAHFQLHIMEEAVLQLRERKIFLGLKSMESFQWLNFRELVLREWPQFISGKDMTITLPVEITKLDGPVQTVHSHETFQKWLEPQLDNLVETARGLLEECGVDTADVEQLLLAGESNSLTLLARSLTDSLKIVPARGGVGLLAAGAAILAISSDAINSEPVADEVYFAKDPAPTSSAMIATEHISPPKINSSFANPSLSAVVTPRNSTEEDQWTLGSIRQRWEAGDREVAIGLLETLLVSAKQMRHRWLTQLGVAQKSAQPRGTPRQFINVAMDELGRGELDSAIAWSHEAYRAAADDPEIFAGMMKVHFEAAKRMTRPEEYQHSIHTLLCAHQHDQTDRTIQKALARRHYEQALVMAHHNNLTNALDCLRQAIRFDPRDKEIVELKEQMESAMSKG